MKKQKPKQSSLISLNSFRSRYWLKVELIDFCKQNDLATAGSKQALVQCIEAFIATGQRIKPALAPAVPVRDSHSLITRKTLVINYKNDAMTRAFFVECIGEHFHFDAYLRQFTNKNNITKGLTYGDLVEGWLLATSKRNQPDYQSKIGKQFEYNQFTRDFFENEKNMTRADAINAWKIVKTLPGPKTYKNFKLKIARKRKSAG